MAAEPQSDSAHQLRPHLDGQPQPPADQRLQRRLQILKHILIQFGRRLNDGLLVGSIGFDLLSQPLSLDFRHVLQLLDQTPRQLLLERRVGGFVEKPFC